MYFLRNNFEIEFKNVIWLDTFQIFMNKYKEIWYYIPTFKSLLLVSLRPERQGNIIRSVSSRPNIVSEIKKKNVL